MSGTTDQGAQAGTSPGAGDGPFDPADRQSAIDRILEELTDRVDGDRLENVAAFTRAALRHVPPLQLVAADPEETVAQLIDAYEFLESLAAQQIGIRIFTPDVALDGWSEPGTVVQVCTEDRPFLLSTVTSELELRDLEIVRTLHPIVGVERDDDGMVARIVPARTAGDRESFLHIELDAEMSEDDAEDLEQTLFRLLDDVMAATEDYQAMRERMAWLADHLRTEVIDEEDPDEVEETAALIDWLLDDNFVLLGWRRYEVVDVGSDDGTTPAVHAVDGSGLGILRDESASRYDDPVPLRDLPESLRERFLAHQLLTVSRTNRLSTVRRRVRMDYVGVRHFDQDGNVVGESRVLGLFTRKGYAEPARSTPVLRRKLQQVLEREDVIRGSHDERTIVTLFQALPKDELFQSDVPTLQRTLVGLYHAEEHRETRVLVRTDDFTTTVSVLVAVPRDRYSPQLRRQLMSLLMERYDGERIDVDLSLGERAEALVRFNVHVAGSTIPTVDIDILQREVRALARSWVDDVTAALIRQRGEADGQRLARQYAERLPVSYRDATDVDQSLEDILILDELASSDAELQVALHQDRSGGRSLTRLKVYRQGAGLELSAFLPILESVGLIVVEELPTSLKPDSDLRIHDFGVRDDRGSPIDVERDGARIAETTLACWRGQTAIDSLNRLVLRAGLSWREVGILRAYRRYRRQVGTAFTPQYVNDALADHPEVARTLVAYFHARFDPELANVDEDLSTFRTAVLEACDKVERLDHDRIMRGFLDMMEATLRTNYYRQDLSPSDDGALAVPCLALKLDSSRVPDPPQPVPHREIYVHAPDLEGIHLRGGPVARGGLRWSDRQDDVRTEILGLMKAQMLKNAVIVPTGAKGGFVLKRPPADPADLRDEVHRQYSTFIRALLDVTDDIRSGEVVPPAQVRRHDGDDPYLVVAADKGTATFSDTANAIALEHGFWLGDAFASGGSHGYDHKKLGITARGAWVAVRHHFLELGIDVQTETTRVVGIGDMSGDVFGNGMLSSPAIQLVAAFDHRHIFLDPAPDPEASYAERQRLFDLPRSSWDDYDRDLVSEGGGVWSRGLKRVPLSQPVQELLRVDASELPPPDLIRAILRAPVDLLFAGGIGTYVKATFESHDTIGDRANDELRVDATDIRARVVGEGANLSVTQAGRIQYARRGGRINMDAIDNAAGVDISDHEVNVKILLGLALEEGRITTAQRDDLLEEVTEDVVAHVLRDVELQVRRLGEEAATSPQHMDAYEHLMSYLEEEGLLHRDVEVLPSSQEMSERTDAGAGLTRPELAVLTGYAKRILTADILDSRLPDDPTMQPVLRTYFPARLVERFDDLIDRHRLRRELVATLVANDLVNRLGITFAFQLAEEGGAYRHDVVAAYWTAREVAGADARWDAVADLATIVGAERQHDLKREVNQLVASLTRTYLAGGGPTDIEALIRRDRPVFQLLEKELMSLGTPEQRSHRVARAHGLVDDLIEPELAEFLACVRDLPMAPAVSVVSQSAAEDDGLSHAPAVADAFLRIGSELMIDRLQRSLHAIKTPDRWSQAQREGLASDLAEVRATAVLAALHESPGLSEMDAVRAFLETRGPAIEHVGRLVADVGATEPVTLDAVAVAARGIREAVTAGRL